MTWRAFTSIFSQSVNCIPILPPIRHPFSSSSLQKTTSISRQLATNMAILRIRQLDISLPTLPIAFGRPKHAHYIPAYPPRPQVRTLLSAVLFVMVYKTILPGHHSRVQLEMSCPKYNSSRESQLRLPTITQAVSLCLTLGLAVEARGQSRTNACQPHQPFSPLPARQIRHKLAMLPTTSMAATTSPTSCPR